MVYCFAINIKSNPIVLALLKIQYNILYGSVAQSFIIVTNTTYLINKNLK